MSNPPAKAPKHRGFKVRCPKEGDRRGLRNVSVDFVKFCKAGCPFYQGKDVGGVFCSYTRPGNSSEPSESNAISFPL